MGCHQLNADDIPQAPSFEFSIKLKDIFGFTNGINLIMLLLYRQMLFVAITGVCFMALDLFDHDA